MRTTDAPVTLATSSVPPSVEPTTPSTSTVFIIGAGSFNIAPAGPELGARAISTFPLRYIQRVGFRARRL